jgi:hypothetical protein
MRDWSVIDDSSAPGRGQVTVSASAPVAADTHLPIDRSVMRMRVPDPVGSGPAPEVLADSDGFVTVVGTGAATGADGVIVARSNAAGSPGIWQMQQPAEHDLTLSMPYDTRAVRYDTTLTFTVSPAL